MRSELILLIPLLPFLGFVLLGMFGKDHFKQWAGRIATTLMLASTLLAFYAAYEYFFVYVEGGNDQQLVIWNYTWLSFSENMSINMGLLIDPISMMMILVVCFVSLMVHIFSLGYMKGEKRFSTYFAFLGLFSFSMLGLVLSSNIFQIYIFWELVGISSFLLIGFYFEKPSAVAASKKAFIVTRFADLGFLIGILILAFYADTLEFPVLLDKMTASSSQVYLDITSASFLGISALTWALALVFMGGAGKSAMFPLHIWLPDAMEGPTPVSALIHAATMVVAGVYLVARLFPVFVLDVAVMQLITWTGILSALLAAIIACTQTDIKRVLAYSTMSQIGYMMFALGLANYDFPGMAGYSASMFHLFTHAFYKSLLFLGAGAIIHMVHSNEMKDMGGLRKLMPITHISFLIGCLSIAGIPPFSGFFSKEEILMVASAMNPTIFYLALFTAFLTAFYMFRLYFSIFWRKTNTMQSSHGEGSLSMKLPLIILAVCAVLAGLIPFSSFVKPVNTDYSIYFTHGFPYPVLIALAGIGLAAYLYKNETDRPSRLAKSLGRFYTTASRKFYIDEIYLFLTKKVLFNLVGRPAAWIDRNIIDGMMNGIAFITASTSNRIKTMQSGHVQSYALYFFYGVAGLAILFIYLWK